MVIYFCYSIDPFIGEAEECIEVLKEVEVLVEMNVLDGRKYSYGYLEDWISGYDTWLIGIFENNSV